MPDSPHPRPRGRTLVYAHRGGAALRPENTIAAFDHARALGADGFELDVQLCRDGTVVVHHDSTLERTTDGRGPLTALSADELARVDAGFSFCPDGGATYPFRGAGIGVPTLREVLRRYPDTPLIIELKGDDRDLALRTVDELRAADAVDRVALGAFDGRALRAARAYEPRIATGASREETRWALYRSWVGWPHGRTAYQEFQVPERFGGTTIVSPRFIEHAHRANLPVKVWTVNEIDDMRRLLTWGADALISDRPDLALEVVGRR